LQPNTAGLGLGKGVTNPGVAKMGEQAKPAGMNNPQFGEMVGFGVGKNATVETANKSAQNLTADAVKAMQTKRLTPEIAKGWRDGYAQEFSRNTNNSMAEARAELMGKIAEFMK
jgi:hypothetical protein